MINEKKNHLIQRKELKGKLGTKRALDIQETKIKMAKVNSTKPIKIKCEWIKNQVKNGGIIKKNVVGQKVMWPLWKLWKTV